MELITMIGLSFVAIGVFAIVWAISTYNGLVRLKALLDEAWSGIDVQLKRRYDLIPNLVETVKGYSSHEKGTLETVTKLRSMAMNATTIEEKIGAEAGLTQALKTLFAVAESYPDLKANTNFLHLQNDLAKIEDELQLSRRYYNGTVRNYNMTVDMFPSRIVAAFGNFKTAPYFELSSTTERETPRFKF